jgi:hypothetical protein
MTLMLWGSMVVLYVIINPNPVRGGGFECGFETSSFMFSWDNLLLMLRFCVFEIEIMMLSIVLFLPLVFIVLFVLLVINMEVGFIAFSY